MKGTHTGEIQQYTSNRVSSLIPEWKEQVQSGIKSDKELLIRFLEEQRPKTKEEYKKTLKEFVTYINETLYITSLHEVTIGSIQDYKYYLTTYTKKNGQNLATATIAQRLRIVSSLFSFGVKTGYFKMNPVTVIKKPRVQNENEHKYLTMEEVSLLLAALKSSGNVKETKSATRPLKVGYRKNDILNARNHLIGLTLFYIGLRISELCSIQWKDFFINPKGHVGIRLKAKGGGTRVVKVRPDLWLKIKEYRQLLKKNTDFSPTDETYLFLSVRGEPLSADYIRRLLAKTCKEAGINKKVTPHWFRHTSASQALALGADIKAVQTQFGWTNLSTPSRYLHNVKGLDETATDVMPEMI